VPIGDVALPFGWFVDTLCFTHPFFQLRNR
jgi:hypothetical protein